MMMMMMQIRMMTQDKLFYKCNWFWALFNTMHFWKASGQSMIPECLLPMKVPTLRFGMV